jgi:hypothetical protein
VNTTIYSNDTKTIETTSWNVINYLNGSILSGEGEGFLITAKGSSENLTSSWRNSSKLTDKTATRDFWIVSINTSTAEGINDSAIYNWKFIINNKSQENYEPGEKDTNTTRTETLTREVRNASTGDAHRFGASSQLGVYGKEFTYYNLSSKTTNHIRRGAAIVGQSDKTIINNKAVGTFLEGTGGPQKHFYNYTLVDAVTGKVVGDAVYYETSHLERTVNNIYDVESMTYRAILNSTEPGFINTNKFTTESKVCQANELCTYEFSIVSKYTSLAQVGVQNVSSVFLNSQGYEKNQSYLRQESNTSYANKSGDAELSGHDYKLKELLANQSTFITNNISKLIFKPEKIGANGVKGVTFGLFTCNLLDLKSPLAAGKVSGPTRKYNFTRNYTTDDTTVYTYSLTDISDAFEDPAGVKSSYTEYENSNKKSGKLFYLRWIVDQNITKQNPPAGSYAVYNMSFDYKSNCPPNKGEFECANTTDTITTWKAGDSDTSFGFKFCVEKTTERNYGSSTHTNVYLTKTTSCLLFNNSLQVVIKYDQWEIRMNQDPKGTRLVTTTIGKIEISKVSSNLPPASYPGGVFPPAKKRRILMEKPASAHRQASTAAPTATGGNVIFISCFTGFGPASLIRISSIVDSVPSIDACLIRLANERPNFTVQKLRAAYNDYLAKNPSAF